MLRSIRFGRIFRANATIFPNQQSLSVIEKPSAIGRFGLRNGVWHSEVEAAHILPVEKNGPDSVANGLALSGTLHWMYDRGLISVDEDYSLLVAEGSIAAEVAGRLFLPERRILVQADAALRPHPPYLRWHQETRFKG